MAACRVSSKQPAQSRQPNAAQRCEQEPTRQRQLAVVVEAPGQHVAVGGGGPGAVGAAVDVHHAAGHAAAAGNRGNGGPAKGVDSRQQQGWLAAQARRPTGTAAAAAARRRRPPSPARSPRALEGHRVRRQQRRHFDSVAQPLAHAAQLALLAVAPGQQRAARRHARRVIRACVRARERAGRGGAGRGRCSLTAAVATAAAGHNAHAGTLKPLTQFQPRPACPPTPTHPRRCGQSGPPPAWARTRTPGSAAGHAPLRPGWRSGQQACTSSAGAAQRPRGVSWPSAAGDAGGPRLPARAPGCGCAGQSP